MKDLSERIKQAKIDGKFIQTNRLLLLPLEVSDAVEAFKWCGDPEVNTFMSYTLYTNVNDVAQWIEESGHDCFGFLLRENGQLIGSGDVCINGNGDFELGYNLAKTFWGNGYATEASKAMLALRVAQGASEFACQHAQANVRSARVIQKCGFVNPVKSSYTCFDGIRTFDSLKYTLHIDSFEMNVDGEWFDKIVNGSKTIELRLNDERRRNIKAGDYIVLNNLAVCSDYAKCVAQVTALHKFDSFKTLYDNLDMRKCGYGVNDKPDFNDMLKYYSAECQTEWGVVGIEFELLAAF